MNWPLYIARRYLFSKKSTNAINLITGISVLGITVGTAALILELAVFNGFETLLSGLFNQFNPAVKITPAEGKFFELDSLQLNTIHEMEGVLNVSQTLEEIALFEYGGNTVFASIKGVDSNFVHVTGLENVILTGSFQTQTPTGPGTVVGSILRNRLGLSMQNPLESLKVYVPRKKKMTLLDRPFKTAYTRPTGVFSFQQDYDNQYIFSDLGFVQGLLDQPGRYSALELAVEEKDVARVKKNLQSLLGDNFRIRDRYEQDEAFFKLMNLEKWMFYALFCLTLVLIAFNLIGALWMLVLEKKKDISILKSLGASSSDVFRIFASEGLLISVLGIALGSLLAIGLYYYHVEFGLITIPEGFIVDRYPMDLRWSDFVTAGLTMLAIGWLAAFLPAQRARKISSFVRSE